MIALTDIAVGLLVIVTAIFIGTLALALYKEVTGKDDNEQG